MDMEFFSTQALTIKFISVSPSSFEISLSFLAPLFSKDLIHKILIASLKPFKHTGSSYLHVTDHSRSELRLSHRLYKFLLHLRTILLSVEQRDDCLDGLASFQRARNELHLVLVVHHGDIRRAHWNAEENDIYSEYG